MTRPDDEPRDSFEVLRLGNDVDLDVRPSRDRFDRAALAGRRRRHRKLASLVAGTAVALLAVGAATLPRSAERERLVITDDEVAPSIESSVVDTDVAPSEYSAPQEQTPATTDQLAPITWSTETVNFAATSLSIDVNGDIFTAADSEVVVDGDPGGDRYQTLELEWMENGVEMRWYVYFVSDGIDWWANEFRTRDGNADAEWVTFTGEFFRTPLGEAFTDDVDLAATEDGITSRLRVENITLQAFTTNDARPTTAVAPP